MRTDEPRGEGNGGDDEAAGEELEAEILRADEPLETRLPGADPEAGVSVLAEGPLDTEGELIGEAVGELDPFTSPEESAMSIRDRAPGATDHDDKHGVHADDEDDEGP